uniref:uncharacterized protein LOC105351007 n=1 Tax=Fragaria vesca subsp. vesca TaxID=101020 RepID=UPI0005C947B1|nr:PREDICTED: uncharacterized protein LOC105351007 [Fragaria vesca subsp. vesca]
MEIQKINSSLIVPSTGMTTKLGSDHHQPEEDRPLAPTGRIHKEEEEPKPLRGGISSSSNPPETGANQPKMCRNCGKLYTTRYCNLKCLYYDGPLLPSRPCKQRDVKDLESRRGETTSETNPEPESLSEPGFFCEWFTKKDLDRHREMMRKYPALRV